MKDQEEDFNLSSLEVYELAKKCFDVDHLMHIILETSNIAWDNRISRANVEDWLKNFTGEALGSDECERAMALWLLSHYSFYTTDQIKILCKDIFQQFMHRILSLAGKSELAFDDIDKMLKNTCFLGLGNASESGMHILYFFRQVNELPIFCFSPLDEKEYENIVFIDDVTMSGDQALEYMGLINTKTARTFFLTLFATEQAKISLLGEDREETYKRPDILISSNYLDKRDKAFSNESYLFSMESAKPLLPYVRKMCEYYGNKITTGYMRGHPLGYDDGEYLIGFSHNTPDNTLPIFWETGNNWKPLFTREKKTQNITRDNLDEQYYY